MNMHLFAQLCRDLEAWAMTGGRYAGTHRPHMGSATHIRTMTTTYNGRRHRDVIVTRYDSQGFATEYVQYRELPELEEQLRLC